MIYQLTEKGKQVWIEGDLKLGCSLQMCVSVPNRKTEYIIANGPLEIESLIRLGLIKDVMIIKKCPRCGEGLDNTYWLPKICLDCFYKNLSK